jgi:hypothetical protein
MIKFYHKSIANQADIATHLNIMMKKDAKFVWGIAQQPSIS